MVASLSPFCDSIMSIACWNIIGGARKNALIETRDFCLHNNVRILMLCEVKSPPSQAMISQCGFHAFDFIPTIDYSYGLWLMWKTCNIQTFSLSIIYEAARFMSCLVPIASSNISYVAIFIYAPAKKEFWSELIAYALSLQLPYVILGDFNEISNENDKKGA